MKMRIRLWIMMGISSVLAGCTVVSGSIQEQASSPVPTATVPTATEVSRAPASSTPISLPPTDFPTAVLPTLPPTEPPFPTPALLSKEAILSCPVSLPNLSQSPDEYYISTENGFGNPERTIFIGLWDGGKVFFYPGGAGNINRDGSMGMKFWFYRTIPGEVVFSGRRLDASAPPMPEIVLRGKEDGYPETGFHPAGLVFPTEGCWEVTASVGQERMTFMTLVAKVPFEPLMPAWLPQGLRLKDTDLSGLPRSFRLILGYPDGSEGEVIVETTHGAQEKALPSTGAVQQVTVNGQPGVCAQGAQDAAHPAPHPAQGQGQARADGMALEWSNGETSYRISQTKLRLLCEDLLHIAGTK